MAENVERPTFHEGQVISAADLNATVDYGRDARARHQRYQHLWGIVTGLELETSDRSIDSTAYKEVEVQPGIAIDGTGRAIVVVEAVRLSEDLFDQLNVAVAETGDTKNSYPVFLQGRDESSSTAGVLAGACETGQETRVAEAYEVTFGRQGDELDLDDQQTPELGDGPGGAAGATGWRILLGFVQWNSTINRFEDASHEADGVGRRYAGLRAGEVMANGDKLVLRSAEAGEDGTPVVELDSGTGGSDAKAALNFGPQNSSGQVTPVMTVDTDGNLTVTGKIVGALAGGVQVESGIATDGMLLPLPAGITQEQVDDGEVVLQIHVTPRYQPTVLSPAPPAGERWLAEPIECRVDGRRVFCRFRWRLTDDSDNQMLPAACDYTLMAFPAEA